MAAKRSGGNGSARKGRPVGTVKTQRMRRMACDDCGYTVWVTRKWMAAGLPQCPCGGTILPDTLDDLAFCVDAGAMTAEQVAVHPTWVEYQRAVASAWHGQAGPARSMRVDENTLRSPEQIAAEKIEKARRKEARERQLSGLRRGNVNPSSAKPDDDIPF